MNGHQAASQLRALARSIREEVASLRLLAASATTAAAQVERERVQAAAEAARVYLPELSPAALANAEQRTGFRGFSRRDPLKALAHEAARLASTISGIEADPRYVGREGLVGPYGSLTRQIAEAESLLEPWEQECARFEQIPGFLELVHVGYDTPAFAVRWWEPGYWRLWNAGDKVCEALKLADFGDDVLPAWRKVSEPRDHQRAELTRLRAARDAILGLVQTHDQAQQRVRDLPGIYLQECQDQIAAFLLLADIALLEQWRGEDRAVEMALRTLSGLHAKKLYFEEQTNPRGPGLGATIADLEARASKLEAKAAKWSMPKRAGAFVPDGTVPVGLDTRMQRLAAQRARLASNNARVLTFHEYHTWSTPSAPELWYVAFTHGGTPHAWTPGFRAWHASHGDATMHREGRDDAVAAASEVAASGEDFSGLGDLS